MSNSTTSEQRNEYDRSAAGTWNDEGKAKHVVSVRKIVEKIGDCHTKVSEDWMDRKLFLSENVFESFAQMGDERDNKEFGPLRHEFNVKLGSPPGDDKDEVERQFLEALSKAIDNWQEKKKKEKEARDAELLQKEQEKQGSPKSQEEQEAEKEKEILKNLEREVIRVMDAMGTGQARMGESEFRAKIFALGVQESKHVTWDLLVQNILSQGGEYQWLSSHNEGAGRNLAKRLKERRNLKSKLQAVQERDDESRKNDEAREKMEEAKKKEKQERNKKAEENKKKETDKRDEKYQNPINSSLSNSGGDMTQLPQKSQGKWVPTDLLWHRSFPSDTREQLLAGKISWKKVERTAGVWNALRAFDADHEANLSPYANEVAEFLRNKTHLAKPFLDRGYSAEQVYEMLKATSSGNPQMIG